MHISKRGSLAALSDVALVKYAQQGRQDAFEEIYKRHFDAIYTYVYYRVADGALAEDLSAEVFVRLVDKIRAYDHTGRPLLAWLYTIARNLVIDHYRKTGQVTWLPLDDRMEASREEHPAEQAEEHLDQMRLARAMENLTEVQRQVILLKFVHGYSNGEVAERLGKEEGAIKSLQHRALETLKRVLNEE